LNDNSERVETHSLSLSVCPQADDADSIVDEMYLDEWSAAVEDAEDLVGPIASIGSMQAFLSDELDIGALGKK
jgi:hypothetical protein